MTKAAYNCTVQLYFWRAQLRSDAKCVPKARLLSQQVSRYSEVADLPHHCLSTGLLILMQDWAFLCRCSEMDRPNTSDSMGLIDILHGTPSLDCSQMSSFLSLITSILVLLAISKPLFQPLQPYFFQLESACSSSSACCAASLVWGKGVVHYCTIKLLR